jgi:hypothetical protein
MNQESFPCLFKMRVCSRSFGRMRKTGFESCWFYGESSWWSCSDESDDENIETSVGFWFLSLK